MLNLKINIFYLLSLFFDSILSPSIPLTLWLFQLSHYLTLSSLSLAQFWVVVDQQLGYGLAFGCVGCDFHGGDWVLVEIALI